MVQRNTFSILFYIRKNRSNQEKAPVYLRFTMQGQRVAFPINISIKVKDWDSMKACAKTRTSDSEEINSNIDFWRNKVYESYKELLESGQTPSAELIRNKILGIEQKQFTLISLATQHNDRMKALIGNSTTYGSYKNYKTTLKFLKDFLKKKFKLTDIALSQLNAQFMLDFVYYLQTKKDSKCKNNGAMKHAQRLKKFVNLAIANEWLTQDPFKNFKIKFEKRERNILNMSEVKVLEEIIIESVKLQKIRDIFLFAIFTGLSYIDVFKLKKEHIVKDISGQLWIHSQRTKTKINLKIPILPKAEEILNKYGLHLKGSAEQLLPVISSQKFNDYLKELATLAKVNKYLTFHVARHTFATTITLNNGMPIETVSKLLGHTNLRTTQIYSKVLDEKIFYDMEELKKRLPK